MNSTTVKPRKYKTVRHQKKVLVWQRLRRAKAITITLMISLIAQVVYPNISYALTGGPATPDFSSFEPVATTNMVNEFTGQFVYNLPVIEIPGSEGGGYALSLSYHAGDGPETEASWVGAGWTLNPGSITRTKRGLPDDFKGETVKYYNDVPRNWTISASGLTGIQAYSVIGNVTNTVRYNNYKGFGFTKSFGVNALNGVLSVGYHLSAGEGTFSFQVNPAAILSQVAKQASKTFKMSGSNVGRAVIGLSRTGAGQRMISSFNSFVGSISSNYISYMLTESTMPSTITPYTGETFSGNFSGTVNAPPTPIGFDMGATVSYTYQENVAEREIPAYGYMYSADAKSNVDENNEAIMDYTVENESPYNPRDMYLPVPTSTPDAFFVSGEGIGGGFRMYQQRIGKFSPNYAHSEMSMNHYGANAHTGWTFGAGGETSVNGEKSLTAKSVWQNNKSTCSNTTSSGNMDNFFFVPTDYRDVDNDYSESNFMRFNNDLGGNVLYEESNWPLEVEATECNGPILAETAKVLLKDDNVPTAKRSGRATYIGYNTNAKIKQKHSTTYKRLFAYCNDEEIHSLAGRDLQNNDILDDLIGEVSITNEDGNNHIYGLPVYAADEKNMQRGVSGDNVVLDVDPDNYLVKADVSNNFFKVGQEIPHPYVTSYLLTSITTPDYIDVNLNGPDEEDFGGYTKFKYSSIHGQPDKSINRSSGWYNWRVPYQGYYFNPMRISDKTDNIGSYQSGVRENYVLERIETKTHYATFQIIDLRDDAQSAATDEAHNGKGLGQDITMKGMRALQKIELYAKAQDGGADQLIKTVNFEYDYSAWNGTPNNHNGGGKLTLKRVWFDYNGVYNAVVSPYEFHYEYPNMGTQYPSKYQYILDEMNGTLNQIPDYEPYIDCWGNYQYDGQARRKKYLCGVDQQPDDSFDPAAWQLKRIVLPSGGEIHVQYEQNSYSHVQNRNAHVMVSLKPSSSEPPATGSKYYLDLTDLNLDASSTADKNKLVDLIRSAYPAGTYMRYKFFYTLLGTSSQGINSCNGDYVDGYSEVESVGIETSGSNTGDVYVKLKSSKNLPYQMCKDYVRKEVGGKLFNGNDCSPKGTAGMFEPGKNGKSVENDMANLSVQLFKAVASELDPGLLICQELNTDLSYLRIPTWNKKGGGIRVKRLMMYDKGVEPGTEGLYGTEYVYENGQTNESWGVATNEPLENKDENPLVTYLEKRKPQTTFSRLFNGRDVDQFEGPFSMNVIPQASVGYRKVIKKNIHNDRYTGTGYTVLEYNTVRDYPFDRVYPNIGPSLPYTKMSKAPGKDSKIKIGLFSYTISKSLNVAQSYSFILNEMHGQPKSITNYPGAYYPTIYNTGKKPNFVSQTRYEYFEPGEPVPMYNFTDYSTSYESPGREMDITIDMRSVEEYSRETRITGDFTVAQVGQITIPYPIAFPIESYAYINYNSLVSNKVVHYPAIVKSSTVINDGVVSKTENIGFDKMNTKPMVTRTFDSYYDLKLGNSTDPHKGIYTTTTVPASSQYPQLGQKAWNEKYVYYTDLSIPESVVANGPDYDVQGANKYNIFSLGDLVAVHMTSGAIDIANVIELNGNNIKVAPANRYNSSVATGNYDKVEVIKSGYENKLTATMGGLVEYGADPENPVTPDGYMQLLNDALVNVGNHSGTFPYYEDVYTTNLTHNLIWLDHQIPGHYCELEEYYVDKIRIGNDGADIYLVVFYKNGGTSSFITGNFFMGDPAVIITTVAQTLLPGPITHPSGFRYDFQSPTIVNGLRWMKLYNSSTQDEQQLIGNFCTDPKKKGVLKASTTTYKDDWESTHPMFNNPWIQDYLLADMNDYEAGRKGKWRPHETYVFEDVTHEGADPTKGQRNYNGAGVSKTFIKVPWVNIHTSDPDRWIKTNEIVSYTPDGFAFEEKDAYGVYSSAKYGYNDLLPYAVAKNAPERSYRFEGFEMQYPNDSLEDRLTLDNPNFGPGTPEEYPHTGKKFYYLPWSSAKGNPTPNVKGAVFRDVLDHEGLGHVIRYWAIESEDDPGISISIDVSHTSPVIPPGGTSWAVTPKAVARTSHWVLYEVDCRHPASIYHPVNNPVVNINDFKDVLYWYTFYYDGTGRGPEGSDLSAVSIDDIRIQPKESEMTAYVYDPINLRVTAVLDGQHFATFYQYNGEGKLIKKKLETERGTKTVEEASYNTPKTYQRP